MGILSYSTSAKTYYSTGNLRIGRHKQGKTKKKVLSTELCLQRQLLPVIAAGYLLRGQGR